MAILFHGLLSKILDWMGDSPYTVKTTKAPVVLKLLNLPALLPGHLGFHKLSFMTFDKLI